ncbi:MAG: hypothetical protein E7081_04010 [Bacteroidales bacterium]|nr:hypothetical protein [Bacteroidales bacterium]
MKTGCMNFWGYSRWWWAILVVGILCVIAGFFYWLFPVMGYAVASMLFGWLLIISGVVQLCVSASARHPKGWGWWLVGGILNIFVGFMLVRSIVLSEIVLPYFFAIVFFFWGVNAIVGAIFSHKRKYWWINLINGILLLVISYFFIESGYLQDAIMISLLTSIAFIYWGFTIMIIANDMRPEK